MEQTKLLTPKYKMQLSELGLTTPIKALYHFPKSVQFIEVKPYLPGAVEGVFAGTVATIPSIFRKGRTSFVRFKIATDGVELPLICFNQTFLQKTLVLDMEIVIIAKCSKQNWIVSKVYYNDLDAIGTESAYALLKGMRQPKFREYLTWCLEVVDLANFVPDLYHQKYQLIARKEAFKKMHFPQSDEDKKQAIRYFKYEEAYIFQLNLLMRKQFFQRVEKPVVKEIKLIFLTQLQEMLPFELTAAQLKVIAEMVADFKSEFVMHRLVQGDVGSGKTVVALIAAYLQIKAGYQVAFLAPTTILAQQHFTNTNELLAILGVKVAFLRSQTAKKQRDLLLEELKNQEIDLIIGTHALLEEDVDFKNLGLAIIDEQQRFGVEQRKKLRKKGASVDILYMTATPIPRTLAMSVFGDLDVSTIDELPAGRVEITTRIVQKKHWENVLQTIIQTVERKEQVYVVCPLIEASEILELGNLTAVFESLAKDLPGNYKIEMLHGKQKNEQKQEVITNFSDRLIDVLVATTVVEVGVHVDSATLMIIYDAQQFGLSQLHQLRGRVGRSSLPSTCLLVSDHKNKRLTLLVKSQDGFYLAQEDLKLRGPGDFFGLKQSGVPTFRVLDLIEDINVLTVAKGDALATLNEINQSTEDNHPKIKKYIESKQKQNKEFLD
ncbi:MAG: ATP-dependent DNA helicase RecG [Culicoidibacterales bacterium]